MKITKAENKLKNKGPEKNKKFILTTVKFSVIISNNYNEGGVRVKTLQSAVYTWQWRVLVYFTEPRPV